MKEKWIELLKWFIGSVVIVIVTLIIDTGFKEREAGIKEMEVYDKYVDIILKADNIEQRWKLCEYFSIVTPTERLRVRWQAYKDTISSDYYKWKSSRIVDSIGSGLNDLPLIGTENTLKKESFYESRGFDALLSKDYNLALESFKKAESIKPSYHNCYEIINYLRANESLKNSKSEEWKLFYKELSSNLSWGMSEDYKDRFIQSSN